MATALFLDHEFPPTDNSLGPDLCKKGITWRRAPEATGAQGETDLFRGGIDPSDIKQVNRTPSMYSQDDPRFNHTGG